MSRIDDLVAEFCPEGVEFKPIEALFTLRNGYTPSKSDSSFWEDGTIPWFRMEDIRANGRILDDSLQKITPSAVKGGRLFPADSLLVATSATIGEHALVRVPHLSNQRFTSLTLEQEWEGKIDMMFAFYYGFRLSNWCQANVTTSSFASVDMAGFRKFRFPVPPMEVQREIVRILDTFSALEAELEAELEARRVQYARYRDQLFSPDNLEDSPLVPLAELAGEGFFKDGDWVESKDQDPTGDVRLTQLADVGVGVFRDRSDRWMRDDQAIRLNCTLLEPGDLLIARMPEPLGRACQVPADIGRAATVVDVAILRSVRPDTQPRYVMHAINSYWVNREILSFQTGGTRQRISRTNLGTVRIPLPALVEQERIVTILDNFDALVNDLSVGLPAELAARRTQYEHYRDRLLTFEERV